MLKTTTLILIMLLIGCNNLVSNPVIKESSKTVQVKESVKPSEIPKVLPSLPVQSSNSISSEVKTEPKVDTSIKQSGQAQVVIPSVVPSTIQSNSPNLTGNEDLEKEEKQQEEIKGQELPNRASIYYLFTENINAKEFIEKLKKEEFILSITENNG